MRLWRRGILAIRYRIYKSSSKCRLESGGAMIAFVGGDGAGKSTAIEALYSVFSKHFEMSKVHMGKPSWSWTTIAIRGVLKVGQLLGLYPLEASFEETLEQDSAVSPGYPWLIREVCRARDRYWTYVRARRFAARGGLVIFDRFPLAPIQLMDGPQTERFITELSPKTQSRLWMSPTKSSRFAQFLIKKEKYYYCQIMLPEVVVVLRLDPEIAVERKPQDNAITVRRRATEICEIDWAQLDAHVMDTSKSKSEVASELKAYVWSKL